MPASATTPIGSLKSVLVSPFSSYSGATAPYSSPGTPKTTISFCSSTLAPEPLTSSAESSAHSRSLHSSASTPSFVKSKPWFREVSDNTSRTLQFSSNSSQTSTQPSQQHHTAKQSLTVVENINST